MAGSETQMEIYPGEYRQAVQAGDVTAVFDEPALEYLSRFSLDGYVTRPETVDDFVASLTPDKAFPGIEHFREPRVYLLESEAGERCVVKPFYRFYDRDSGFRHLGTQELLHAALQDVPGYYAARVFGHISMSQSHGAGYSLVEYIDGPALRDVEKDIDYTNLLTESVTRAVNYLRYHNLRKEMLPPGTTLKDFYKLREGVYEACETAVRAYGVPVPRISPKGFSNWDMNSHNLMCTADKNGAAQMVLIDQSADLFS